MIRKLVKTFAVSLPVLCLASTLALAQVGGVGGSGGPGAPGSPGGSGSMGAGPGNPGMVPSTSAQHDKPGSEKPSVAWNIHHARDEP
jgi:hypothetical protein